MKSVFLVFSATTFKIGKFIRFFTREKYSHTAVSFDKELNNAYTIGRIYYDTPFVGGLTRDFSERYEYKGNISDIAICEIKVTDEQYGVLSEECEKMYSHREDYIYNYFSALGNLFRKKIKIKNAYTCVDFSVKMLSTVCSELDSDKFYSVCDLLKIFEDRKIYEGKANFPESYSEEYHTRHSFGTQLKLTFGLLKDLVGRK